MQLKLFVLPIKNLGAAEAEMNAFLRGHRVLAVKKEFVADGENSFWRFCVEYLDGAGAGALLPGGRPKIDYKEVLKPEEFEVFSRLREWRKAVAEKEGVPVHMVLTNEQLAQNYHYFTIHDPKERTICAAQFRERVLHHALMNVCEPVLERAAVFDSYACRRGKGQLAAVRRAESYARRYGWFLKLDVRKYFDSVDHTVLRSLPRARRSPSRGGCRCRSWW